MPNKKFDDEFPESTFYVRSGEVSHNHRTIFASAILSEPSQTWEVERIYGMGIKNGRMFLKKLPSGKHAKLEKRKSDAMWSTAKLVLSKERDRLLNPQMELVLEN